MESNIFLLYVEKKYFSKPMILIFDFTCIVFRHDLERRNYEIVTIF